MEIKRLLALSDSHGHIAPLHTVLRWVNDNCAIDTAVFLGDGIHDLRRAAPGDFSCAWEMVRGNNDYDSSAPEAACLDFGGHRFFLCHGHRYALYRNYDTLIAAARNMNADAALFGHIHVPILENTGELLLINPGSISRPRSRIGATFAIINCLPEMPPDVHFWGVSSQGHIGEILVY